MRAVPLRTASFLVLCIVACTGEREESYISPGFDDDDFENFLEDMYLESSREKGDITSSRDKSDNFFLFPDGEFENGLMSDILYGGLEKNDEEDSDWNDMAETNLFGASQNKQRLLDFAVLEDILDNNEEGVNEDQWSDILPTEYVEENKSFDIPGLNQDSVTLDGKKERKQNDISQKAKKQDKKLDGIDQSDEDQLRSLLVELEDSTEMKKSQSSEDDSTSSGTSTTNLSNSSKIGNDIKVEVKLPGVSVNQDDTYLCTALKITDYTDNYNSSVYITRYIPHAKETIAHHMLLYGCMSPGITKPGVVWNCGGAMNAAKKNKYPLGSLCGSGGETILWAWAKNAPAFTLPRDIGFKVGPGTNVRYLVLQVHYKSAKVFRGGRKDYSAVTIMATKRKMPRLAGVYILASTLETVMPHQTKNFDIYCKYQQTFNIHPFAFRTHTHALGVEVIGFRIRDAVWTLIGAKNPQLPEAFYSVATKNMTIRYGDWLTARCVMRNFRAIPTSIGSKHTDEMCNLYMMFWTDVKNEEKMDSWQKGCNNGFPWIHWSSLPGFYS